MAVTKKSFTGTGVHKQDNKPEYKKDILDEIAGYTPKEEPTVVVQHETSNNNDNNNINNNKPKATTFLLSTAVVETILDFVYTQKVKGNFMFTQQDLIEQALAAFLKDKEIIKRPSDFIEKRGRKKTK